LIVRLATFGDKLGTPLGTVFYEPLIFFIVLNGLRAAFHTALIVESETDKPCKYGDQEVVRDQATGFFSEMSQI